MKRHMESQGSWNTWLDGIASLLRWTYSHAHTHLTRLAHSHLNTDSLTHVSAGQIRTREAGKPLSDFPAEIITPYVSVRMCREEKYMLWTRHIGWILILCLTFSFARSRESKGCPNSGFDRGVRGRGRYPLKPSIFASLLETKEYPEHTAARSSREYFQLK